MKNNNLQLNSVTEVYHIDCPQCGQVAKFTKTYTWTDGQQDPGFVYRITCPACYYDEIGTLTD